jgi:hypothetical protein
MTEFDHFARVLLEESKRFLEKAMDSDDDTATTAYLHASLNLGFCAFEGHVNGIADDLAERPELELVERGLLTERDVRFRNGKFELTSSLKMSRLEDRIEFLIHKFSGAPVDKGRDWWDGLKAGLDLRNKLTHPKEPQEITAQTVERALLGILEALDVLYRAVYKSGYPAAKRGVGSTLTF